MCLPTLLVTKVFGVENRHVLLLAWRHWSFVLSLALKQAGSLMGIGTMGDIYSSIEDTYLRLGLCDARAA